MQAQHKIWCDEDEHHLYENYADFNEWLDGDEGLALREQYGIDGLNQPSKAFYTGDKEAYEEAFRQYRIERRHEALSLAWPGWKSSSADSTGRSAITTASIN